MIYKGLFIDDVDVVYAETLSSCGQLEFQAQDVEEVAFLAKKVMNSEPIIVAVDYRLDEQPANLEADQTYKGSALAQHLRDACIERPDRDFALVLVSAESKIKSLYRPDATAHDLFDRVYVKEDINKRRALIRRELVELCRGYERLRAVGGAYDIVELMAGTDRDRPYVDIQEIRAKLNEAAAPHVAARILFGLIDRSGPLLNADNVCAYLGVARGGSEGVFDAMGKEGVAYEGIFGEAWPRWWANRLESWAYGIFNRRSTGIPAAERAQRLSDHLGLELEPARSPWNDSPYELISFACASCFRGTELRHSVAAFEPSLPRYAVRRRICWDCVQKDQHERMEPPIAVDDSEHDLVEHVRARDRSSGDIGGTE